MNNKKQCGKQFGRYTLLEKIGHGGNADVYKATDGKNEYAIKLLRKDNQKRFKKKYKRFLDEISIVEQYQAHGGIIPIVDKFLPENYDGEQPWYIMPIAKPINEIFEISTSIEAIVTCVWSISKSLGYLQNCGIVHRDIKPSNLYYYQGTWCVGDFGLVDYPGKDDLTAKRESVGPKWTIAPEMKRDSINADGKKADVYSLAKTLWILLTEEKDGFEGQYNTYDSGIRLRTYRKHDYLVEIEDLLTRATHNDPQVRPTMDEFSALLERWKENKKSYEKQNPKEWEFALHKAHGNYLPDLCVWSDIDAIINQLNTMSETRNINHILFPGGGGLDLQGVRKSSYDGCIELTCDGGTYIVQPTGLFFHGMSDEPFWAYYRLEAKGLPPCGAYEYDIEHHPIFEDVIELSEGDFIDIKYLACRHYKDKPFPQGFQVVSRQIGSGAHLILAKTSVYNRFIDTYDGRHGKMSDAQFAAYLKDIKHYYDCGISDTGTHSLFRNEEGKNKLQHERETKQLIISEQNFYNAITAYFDNNYFKVENVGRADAIDVCTFWIILCISVGIERQYFLLDRNNKFIKANKVDCSTRYLFSDKFKTDAGLSFSSRLVAEDAIAAIQSQLEENGLWNNQCLFTLQSKRHAAPVHLFTRQEIYDAMRRGDDEKNNSLVVDEYGFATLINDEDQRFLRRTTYPVRGETFDPYGNYVGKYADLNNREFELLYLTFLSAWKDYLLTEESQYVDYYETSESEEELILSIRTIIEQKSCDTSWKSRCNNQDL